MAFSPLSYFTFAVCLCGVLEGVWTNQWSMNVPSNLTCEKGKHIVLPCTFTTPKFYFNTVIVIWRRHEYFHGPVIFNCTVYSSQICTEVVNDRNQYKLIGDPNNKNISLLIKSLNLIDNGTYFCRVEYPERKDAKYETKNGTALYVTAPPVILNLSISENMTIVCIVEGQPLPSITWHENRKQLLLNRHFVHVTTHLFQIKGELYSPEHGKTYLCTASNTYGTVEESILFPNQDTRESHFVTVAVTVVTFLLILLLLLVLGLFFFFWKKKGHRGKATNTKVAFSRGKKGSTDGPTYDECISSSLKEGKSNKEPIHGTKKEKKNALSCNPVELEYAEIKFQTAKKANEPITAIPSEDYVTYAAVKS